MVVTLCVYVFFFIDNFRHGSIVSDLWSYDIFCFYFFSIEIYHRANMKFQWIKREEKSASIGIWLWTGSFWCELKCCSRGANNPWQNAEIIERATCVSAIGFCLLFLRHPHFHHLQGFEIDFQWAMHHHTMNTRTSN